MKSTIYLLTFCLFSTSSQVTLGAFTSLYEQYKAGSRRNEVEKCKTYFTQTPTERPNAQFKLNPINRRRCWKLFNFLDDYKMSREDENSEQSSSNFPPAICPSEIHRVRFSTTAGDFTIQLDRALSPSGVTRFLELVEDGIFTDQLIYRVEPGFVIQFGVASDPMKQHQWDPQVGAPIAPIPDEPNRQQFRSGSVSFAGSGLNTRSCHIFIALEPGGTMLGEAPHETVLGNIETKDGGMLVLDNIVQNRKDQGWGSLLESQGALLREGNSALDAYPGIDRIMACGRI